MRFLTQLIATVAGVAAAAWIFDGIWFDGPTSPLSTELQEKALPAFLVAFIIWLVTLVVEPVVKLLSLPLVILTLGLFLFVVNALMLMLAGWIAGEIGIGFTVQGFWTALGGSLVITVVGRIVAGVLGDD